MILNIIFVLACLLLVLHTLERLRWNGGVCPNTGLFWVFDPKGPTKAHYVSCQYGVVHKASFWFSREWL